MVLGLAFQYKLGFLDEAGCLRNRKHRCIYIYIYIDHYVKILGMLSLYHYFLISFSV